MAGESQPAGCRFLDVCPMYLAIERIGDGHIKKLAYEGSATSCFINAGRGCEYFDVFERAEVVVGEDSRMKAVELPKSDQFLLTASGKSFPRVPRRTGGEIIPEILELAVAGIGSRVEPANMPFAAIYETMGAKNGS